MKLKRFIRKAKKLFPIIVAGILIINGIDELIKDFSIFYLSITTLMLLYLIASVREMIWGKFVFKENSIFKFEDEFIICVGKYPFKHSSVKRYGKIHFSRINEATFYIFSTSFVLDNIEVIFISNSQKENLKNFAYKHSIPISNRVDIWEKILEPFLDTEFNEDFKQTTIQTLSEQGIAEDEVKEIRKKLPFWFMTFSMEWIYLGQYDVLYYFTSKKNY